ncbi:hypothetical protein C8Q70DRAFT_1023977 [Cubamyces menziesii]|nr:hypothetical protein C8Q70DRAFT_1023977 [Cubamyces menziesii]
MSANPSTPALEPVTGVARALQAGSGPVQPTLFTTDFSLRDRVALVTGANGGLGLESALAFIEAGARAVYCLDIAPTPSEEWLKVKDYVSRMEGKAGEGRLEYISTDVSDQEGMWKIGKMIGDKEGRFDVCVAGAGIGGPEHDCLEVKGEDTQKIIDVNLNGVVYTAQAAGQQMARFGNGGSIIAIASLTGYIAIPNMRILPYHLSKSAVIQMCRNFACELAPKGIRVNSISPAFIKTKILEKMPPEAEAALANMNPMKRFGKPHELRGAVAWLASDASSYCTGSDIFVTGGHHAW